MLSNPVLGQCLVSNFWIKCWSLHQLQRWLIQVLEETSWQSLLGTEVYGQLCNFLDLFSYSLCKHGDISCSNSELFFSSVISLATKCAMPSFRMHLRAHGMVAMVFKTLDDSQHHQVWIDSVFYYSLAIPVYSKVKHLVQCVSGINSVIWETWRETRNKLFVSQWQIPLPLFTCF